MRPLPRTIQLSAKEVKLNALLNDMLEWIKALVPRCNNGDLKIDVTALGSNFSLANPNILASQGIIKCTLSQVLDDMLICTYNGQHIAVAKPYLLRRATWDGKQADQLNGMADGVGVGTYSYITGAAANTKPQERILSMPASAMPDGLAATFLQLITPAYNGFPNTPVSDTILACQPIGGTGLTVPVGYMGVTVANSVAVTYQDVSSDTRSFWTQFPCCYNGFPAWMWLPMYPPFATPRPLSG